MEINDDLMIRPFSGHMCGIDQHVIIGELNLPIAKQYISRKSPIRHFIMAAFETSIVVEEV